MIFNNNLAAIHAYLCADGYVIKNPETQKHKYYYIGLRNTSQVLLEDFQQKFEEQFGLKPIITNEGRCKIQNKSIYYSLTKEFSYYSKNWQMPELSNEQLKYWLRAYFDCESWVFLEHRKNRHIGLDSINLSGIKHIQDSLKRFGIESKMKEVKHRNIYRLLIYGKENLIKFQKEINFLHPQKNEKLKRVINNYVDYNWNFPINNNDELRALISDKARIGKNRIRFNSITKNNLNELSKILLNNFKIESKIYDPWVNGLGNKYYQLIIHKKEQIDKFKEIFTKTHF